MEHYYPCFSIPIKKVLKSITIDTSNLSVIKHKYNYIIYYTVYISNMFFDKPVYIATVSKTFKTEKIALAFYTLLHDNFLKDRSIC